MQKLKLNKPLVIFLTVILFLALELLFLLPQASRRISNLNRKRLLASSKLKAAREEWPRQDIYLNKSKELSEQVKIIQKRFILSQDMPQVLNFIADNAETFKVEIIELSPLVQSGVPLEQPASFTYAPITLKAKSKFHSLAMFLECLQASQYFFEVKELNITSGPDYPLVEIKLCTALREE